MPSLPKMVDLMAIALQLEQSEPKDKLAGAVRNAGRAQSCVADITLARSTLEALAQLQSLGQWAPVIHRLAAEHAMLANAIILYARATATGAKAGERGHTSIRERLTSEQQKAHDWIIDVRNTAVAHVRANEALAEELWHREIIFAKEQGDGSWLPAAMTRRVQVNPILVGKLRGLLEVAEGLLKQTYYKRIEFVARLLERTPGAAERFPKNLIDPISIFGSEQEAKRALDGARPGGRSVGVIDT